MFKDLTRIIILLVILLGLSLLPYFLGPIRVWRNTRQSSKPEVGEFPVDEPSLPKNVAAYFGKVTEALKPLGFETVAGLTLPNQTPKVKAIVLLLVNRAEKVGALATAVYVVREGGAQLKSRHVELVTSFRDNSVVATSNTATLKVFAPREGHTSTRFPMVTQADRLYRLHAALVKQHGNAKNRFLRLDAEFKGDAPAWLARSMVEELESQVEAGYYYHAEEEQAFRPTLKGAVIMTWSLLWPFKAIQSARRDKKARELLKELDS